MNKATVIFNIRISSNELIKKSIIMIFNKDEDVNYIKKLICNNHNISESKLSVEMTEIPISELKELQNGDVNNTIKKWIRNENN